MAHLAEHRRAVNKLAVASSRAFFVSASNDETVKVSAWINFAARPRAQIHRSGRAGPSADCRSEQVAR